MEVDGGAPGDPDDLFIRGCSIVCDNFQAGLEMLRRAADMGHRDATLWFGKLICDTDPAKALEHFRVAASLGSTDAVSSIVMHLYRFPNEITFEDHGIIRAHIDRHPSDTQVMTYYGLIVMDTEPDRANELFRCAASGGHTYAGYLYGLSIMDTDRARAYELIRVAANDGHKYAAYIYGLELYDKGERNGGFAYIQWAAQSDEVPAAITFVANRCKNPARRVAMLERAARLGDDGAKVYLDEIHAVRSTYTAPCA